MTSHISDNFKFHIDLLYSIPEFKDFTLENDLKENFKGKSGAKKLISSFSSFIEEKRKLNDSEELILKLFIECVEAEYANSFVTKLFNINNNFKVNDLYLNDFNQDYGRILTGESEFKEINIGKYKTKKEFLRLREVDDNGLFELYEKYIHYNHPYIFYMISEPMVQAGNYANGINVLRGALKHSFRSPNYYWENIEAVDACATALYQIQYLLGYIGIRKLNEKIENFENKLFKLIFLYLSRVIYMEKDSPLSIDAYSNRARLVRDNKYSFLPIFGLGVNSDIQYMADKYLAYLVACKNNCGAVYQQCFWDSMKMYRHGHHIPNHTGGIQEIEDAKFTELVKKGEFRSISLANDLLAEFENQELNLSNSEIDLVCDFTIRKMLLSNFDDK